MLNSDTIAAIATAPGTGGIGIVRLSGAYAKDILARVFLSSSQKFTNFRPWTLHRGRFVDKGGALVDDVLAVFMPEPKTFTGENVVEIHCHGGRAILQLVLETLVAHGARLAEHGEFSRRALLNGRMDLTQAEAVAEMIAANNVNALRLGSNKLDGLLGKYISSLRETLEQLRLNLCVAIDFPEDEVECLSPHEFVQIINNVREALQILLQAHERHRHWQEGATVVLAGAVNVGKSSLLNALVGYNRALVTDIPGTTRDFLEEYINIDGLSIRLTDTAGLRTSPDNIEQMGIERGRERINAADAILLVFDGCMGEGALDALSAEDKNLTQDSKTILVWNKSDLAPNIPKSWQNYAQKCVIVSAKEGSGLDALCTKIKNTVLKDQVAEPKPSEIVPNMRQAHILNAAAKELHILATDIGNALPYDVCSVRLDSAVELLGQITGLDSPDEVLDKIFSTFCIGK